MMAWVSEAKAQVAVEGSRQREAGNYGNRWTNDGDQGRCAQAVAENVTFLRMSTYRS